MARTSTTWGKGDTKGRPHGAKDKVPRTAKRAVEALIEKFGNDTELIEWVLRRGLQARAPSSFPYLRLIVEHNVGTPDAPENLVDALHRKINLTVIPGPSRGRDATS